MCLDAGYNLLYLAANLYLAAKKLLGLGHWFGLRIIEVSECDVDAEKVSSTVIRQLVGAGKMARAARLLAHPYLVIGRAQRNRIRVEDPLKLLPPPGEYDAHINGKPTRLTVDAAQELITRDILPEGRVVITF